MENNQNHKRLPLTKDDIEIFFGNGPFIGSNLDKENGFVQIHRTIKKVRSFCFTFG